MRVVHTLPINHTSSPPLPPGERRGEGPAEQRLGPMRTQNERLGTPRSGRKPSDSNGSHKNKERSIATDERPTAVHPLSNTHRPRHAPKTPAPTKPSPASGRGQAESGPHAPYQPHEQPPSPPGRRAGVRGRRHASAVEPTRTSIAMFCKARSSRKRDVRFQIPNERQQTLV